MHSLTWAPPISTGFGNSRDMAILLYRVQISRCSDFNMTNPWCESTDGYLSSTSDCSDESWCHQIASGSEGFQYPEAYPFSYNLTEKQPQMHQGLFYYYRVTAINRVGTSNTTDTIFRQFGTIPFSVSFIDYPITFPVPVAIYEGQMQPWTGSPSAISDDILMHLSGFPFVRGSFDLDITVNSFQMQISSVDSVQVVESSLIDGTTLKFAPSNLPDTVKQACGMPCLLDITITMKKVPVKTSTFSVFYFTYPVAQTLSVVPTNGPINGGTVLQLTLLDFEGAETRHGAGLPSLSSVFAGQMELKVVFEKGEIKWKSLVQSDPAKNLGIYENADIRREGAKVFDLFISLPPSEADEGVASISLEIEGASFHVDSSQASLTFDYVGTQILYITPGSGLLNPGSGGMEVNVVVLNLPNDLAGLAVSVGGQPCSIKSISQSDSELGMASAIACQASELPLSMAGTINVQVTVSGMSKILNMPWQYLSPPSPEVNAESIVFDGRSEAWAPSGRKARTAKLLINNLSPRYAIVYDEIRVAFEGDGICSFNGTQLPGTCQRDATDVTFIQVGFNTELSFMTPELMPPSNTRLSISVFQANQRLLTLTDLSSGIPFAVEFRDLSLPRTISWAPSEGPATGGTIYLVGIQSLREKDWDAGSDTFADLACRFGSAEATVVAVLSVAEFQARFLEVQSLPILAEWYLGLSQGFTDQYDKIVKDTRNAVFDTAFDPEAALQRAAIAFVTTPPGTGTVAVSCTAGDAQVEADFTYVQAPTTAATIRRAATDAGTLRAGMGGNERVAIEVENFAIVYRSNEIVVMFGADPLPVSRLAYSTSAVTKLFIVVPASLPRVVEVSVSPKNAPANGATFSFTYFDDRVPVITSLSPYLVYETGGASMTMSVVDLPVLTPQQYRVVLRQGLTVVTVSPNEVTAGIDGAESTVRFTVSSGSAGAASAEIWADVDEQTSKGSDPFTYEYAAIPTTAPEVFQVSPASSSNFGGRKVTVYMRNMKVLSHIDNLRLEVTLDGITHPGTDLNALSSMAQTSVSFTTPAFEGGGAAAVRIWEVGREALAAEATLNYIDENIAVRMYILPDSAKANQVAEVEVGVSRLGALPAVSDMSVDAGPRVSATVVSVARPPASDTATIVVRLQRNDNAHGNV